MKKEFLLGTTGMTGITQNPASSNPEPPKEARKISVATGLLHQLIYFILKKQYGLEEGYELRNIFHDDYDGIEDDTVEICIEPTTEDAAEITLIQSAAKKFLNDLKTAAQAHSLIDIDIEKMSVQAVENLDLHTALSLYVNDDKFDLTTIDKIEFSCNHIINENDPPEMSKQAMNDILALYAGKIRNMDAKEKTKLFEYVEARPYPTRQHFEAAMYLTLQADIPMSMDHIRKAIMREDGIIVPETKDDAYEFGGYH